MKGSKIRLLSAVLCGIAAVVWLTVSVFQMVYGLPLWLILLNVLCAAIWCIACVAQIFYWKQGK